jgi:chromosome segregation ATPase
MYVIDIGIQAMADSKASMAAHKLSQLDTHRLRRSSSVDENSALLTQIEAELARAREELIMLSQATEDARQHMQTAERDKLRLTKQLDASDADRQLLLTRLSDSEKHLEAVRHDMGADAHAADDIGQVVLLLRREVQKCCSTLDVGNDEIAMVHQRLAETPHLLPSDSALRNWLDEQLSDFSMAAVDGHTAPAQPLPRRGAKRPLQSFHLSKL